MSEKASAPDSGRIFLGILAIVVWVVVHLVLFYLFFASGFFIDLAIRMLRAIFMNDAPALSSVSFAWGCDLLERAATDASLDVLRGIRDRCSF